MDSPEPIKDLQALKIENYRRVWRPFMEKYDCQKICELGVHEGENFKQMIKHNPKLAVAVDAWINDGDIAHNDQDFSQEALDEQYKNFKRDIGDKNFVQICREYTLDAVKHFEDNFFDLIYIDADHSYEGCLKDIEAWYPKIKKGKFLTGDDYREGQTSRTKVELGVIKAVNEFAKSHKLKFYELSNQGWAIIKT